MRESRSLFVDVNDDTFHIVEWPGSGDPVLLLHATGFHSRCWLQVAKQLPNAHIYAMDLRFHGQSTDAGEVDWQQMARDVQAVVQALDLQQAVAAGHSIGGHLLARTAAALPERFRQLLLIDPVIMSPQNYASFSKLPPGFSASDHPVARRKNLWHSSDEMYQRFAQRAPFDSWQAQVLRDYCDYALKPSPDAESMQLACSPIHEASIYMNQSGNVAVYQDISRITTPVTLLRVAPSKANDFDLSASPTWPLLGHFLPYCHEVYLPQMNHFIPMQDPQLVTQYIVKALEAA